MGDRIEVNVTRHFHGLPDRDHVRDVARAVSDQIAKEVQSLRRRAY